MRVFSRPIVTGLVTCTAVWFTGPSSFASSINLGSVLPDYGIVSVGPSASLNVNSGPIVGNVLIGDGSAATSSGGGNGQVTGVVDVSGTVSGDQLQNLQTKPAVNVLTPSLGLQAFSDAASLSSTAAALVATQTFGAINGTQTITGNGGLNVIDIASLHNPDLTISGGPNDVFVFDVSGLFQTNRPIVLNGVSPSQILWDLTGTGTVLQTSGGDVLYGTFLATNGGSFQFSSLDLTGELIDTAGKMQFVSNSTMTAQPFVQPTAQPTASAVPEPASFFLLGSGLASIVMASRRKLRL